MPLMLNLLERSLLVTLNQGPGPILDLWSAIAFRAVMAANSLLTPISPPGRTAALIFPSLISSRKRISLRPEILAASWREIR